jgi:hypothetical protein
MNDRTDVASELQRMEEAVMTYCDVQIQHSPEREDKNQKYVQKSWFQGGDSNWVLSQYKTTEPTCLTKFENS